MSLAGLSGATTRCGMPSTVNSPYWPVTVREPPPPLSVSPRSSVPQAASAVLSAWSSRTLDQPGSLQRPDPSQQQLLRSYGIWHLLRRLRRRVEGTETTHNQLATARQHLRGAMVFLDWLALHDLTLATCGQPDLERWLTDDNATHRDEAGHFVRWAKKQKLTRLTYPATRWGGPARVIDTETRWEQARWLLHDPSVKPEDRVAGLLILLYAQWPSAISRLTLEHVEHHDHEVRLRLGREPVVLPEPLAGLILKLVASRSGHAPIGDKEPRLGCSPADNPAAPSAPSNWANDSANSDCSQDKHDPPPSSNLPRTCLLPFWPRCSASTSASRSPGNAPAAATGPPTPPKSPVAAAACGRPSRVPLLMPAIDRLWR